MAEKVHICKFCVSANSYIWFWSKIDITRKLSTAADGRFFYRFFFFEPILGYIEKLESLYRHKMRMKFFQTILAKIF